MTSPAAIITAACLLLVTPRCATSFQQSPPLQSLHADRLSLLHSGQVHFLSPPRNEGSDFHFHFRLFASAADTEGETSQIDTNALSKYAGALVIQVGLIAALFSGLDKLVAVSNIQVPFVLNCFFFYFLALKSRILNPLSNKRPQVESKEVEGAQERKMPSWTPPGFIFPIVWLLLIGPLRAYTTSLIYATTGSYAHPAILSLMLHLSVGDIWNTINNVERRYGASVLGVLCVWISAAFAALNYYQVLPLAGKLLSLKLIWLTVASSLIFQTWRINPDSETGKKDPLLPTTGRGAKTEYLWF